MRRFFSIIAALTVISLVIPASARSVRDFFATEPGTVFPLLPVNTRLDMLDYFDNGQIVSATNNLGNDTQIISLDSTFLSVQTSECRTVELRMFTPSARDTVIAVIETVGLPMADSRISFYDHNWKLLQTSKFITPPTMADFFTKSTPSSKRADLLSLIDFSLIKLMFTGKAHDVVVAKSGLKDFYSPIDYKRFEPYVTDSLFYTFNGKKFNLHKK